MKPFALEAWFSRWDHAVKHNLAASDSETWSLHELLKFADDDEYLCWERQAFGYTDPHGAVWLRAVIAARYRGFTADDVLCFAGAGEGIHVAMHALLGAGDHAVIVVPGYPSMETIPRTLCATTGVALRAESGWSLDIGEVEAALRVNTRLVAINFPNNPTGCILERDRFDALVALCRARGIWLFSDEVYRMMERDPARRLPPVADVYERGLSLDVLSKSYGLPGLRIGWIACRDRALLARMEELKHYISLCNAGPAEILARIALRSADAILARNRDIAERNLLLLAQFFSNHAELFEWQPPEGSVVCYPRYRGPEGVEAFAQRLIEKHGVLTLPASLFRSELCALPKDHIRLGFGRADFAESLAALERAL